MIQDIYVLSGKVETRKGTSAIEFSGIVKAVAKNVSDLEPGDRVCVLAPNTFRTTERVPAWACHKMLAEESFEVLRPIYGILSPSRLVSKGPLPCNAARVWCSS